MLSPRRILKQEELLRDQPLLVGAITSGDHPIQWCVYADYVEWLNDMGLELEDIDLELFQVYALPYSLVFHRKRRAVTAGDVIRQMNAEE